SQGQEVDPVPSAAPHRRSASLGRMELSLPHVKRGQRGGFAPGAGETRQAHQGGGQNEQGGAAGAGGAPYLGVVDGLSEPGETLGRRGWLGSERISVPCERDR